MYSAYILYFFATTVDRSGRVNHSVNSNIQIAGWRFRGADKSKKALASLQLEDGEEEGREEADHLGEEEEEDEPFLDEEEKRLRALEVKYGLY